MTTTIELNETLYQTHERLKNYELFIQRQMYLTRNLIETHFQAAINKPNFNANYKLSAQIIMKDYTIKLSVENVLGKSVTIPEIHNEQMNKLLNMKRNTISEAIMFCEFIEIALNTTIIILTTF